MIIQNAGVCNKCEDFIVSKHRHDYVSCKCGAVAVDGGQEYLRRIGAIYELTDLSWELPDELYFDCAKAVTEAIESGRNDRGIANAVMRKLREADRIIADHEPRIMAVNNELAELMVMEVDGTVNRYIRIVE